jgi:hypothetical protein
MYDSGFTCDDQKYTILLNTDPEKRDYSSPDVSIGDEYMLKMNQTLEIRSCFSEFATNQMAPLMKDIKQQV